MSRSFISRWCRFSQVRRNNNEAKDAHAYIDAALQSLALVNIDHFAIKIADCDLVRRELAHGPHHTRAIIVVFPDHIACWMQAYQAIWLELNREDASILQ